MKGFVLFSIYCLVIFTFQAANAQRNVCYNSLTFAGIDFIRAGLNTRKCDEMLCIVHGNPRTTKCKFLRAVFDWAELRGECEEERIATCPVPQSVASNDGIPSDCLKSKPECDPSDPYRTIDGSCNNLGNPRWGQAGSQQLRLLPNTYDDGQGSPRTRACHDRRLPSARAISNIIHSAGSTILFEPMLSLLVMQMGQFLAHDMVLTKMFTRVDGSPLMCCTSDKNHPQCNTIDIPLNDTFFKPRSCMNFARSNASFDCSSIRQVINSQSSYLDLSTVYGTSKSEAELLRSFSGGKLKTVQNKLPVDFTDSTCILTRVFDPVNYYCPLAGDERVIEQPGLASMHTVFSREHNRLADGLAGVNQLWDDEKLYQEARKINIAQWQNIVYSKFLRTILSQDVINLFDLNVPKYGYNEPYNPYVDATISNAFAVAGFRYGHSQIHDVIGMIKKHGITETQPLERHFFEPDWYHARNGSGLENILHWITSAGCPLTDRKVQDSIRQKLFLDENGDSFDLVSLNIHRGRDHGTPGYTAFRSICGLSRIHHFGTGYGGLVDHDRETAKLLKQAYPCVEDIDLFTGMMTERRSPGSILGPTWQRILASEFKRLRDGDRFFFDRRDPWTPNIGFTKDQLNAIKAVTISGVICLNTDAPSMQLNGFLRPNIASGRSYKNQLRNCNSFKGIDTKLWKEPHF